MAILKLTIFCLINLAFLLFFLNTAEATDLQFLVNPREYSCFFEIGKIGQHLTVDYTVVGTNYGDFDINLQLSDPRERPILTEYKKTESQVKHEIKEDGAYKICFDNSYSKFSSKTLVVSIFLEDQNKEKVKWHSVNIMDLQPEADGAYEMTIKDIGEKLDKVRQNMIDSQSVQDQHRYTEFRDRSLAETSFERVNFWSMIDLFIIVFIGLFQVYSIRYLFMTKIEADLAKAKLERDLKLQPFYND